MKFQDAKYKDLVIGVQERIKEAINFSGETPKFKKGILFSGDTGVGKTYALFAVKNMMSNGPNGAIYKNWVELLAEHKDLIGKTDTDSLIESLFKGHVLILDDIGAEKATEWSTERLYMIIEKAYRKEHILLIGTNLDIKKDQLREVYGDRIVSRLTEMCTLVKMSGEDRRIK